MSVNQKMEQILKEQAFGIEHYQDEFYQIAELLVEHKQWPKVIHEFRKTFKTAEEMKRLAQFEKFLWSTAFDLFSAMGES